MTLVQISYFMTVAKILNFTRAAERLYVSQQVVSKQIRLLEQELGFDLFVRHKRQVCLSKAGKLLYELWLRHESEFHEIVSFARTSNLKRMIKIGILDASKIIDMVLPVLQEIDQRFPDISLEYEMGSFRELQVGLEMKRLDMIITLSTDLPKGHPKEQVCLLKELELGIILSKWHPLYGRENLTMEEVKDEIFYVFDESFTERAADKILMDCERVGFYPEVQRFTNFNLMEVALQSGKGVTIGYEIFFRNSVGKLKLFPILPLAKAIKSDVVIATNSIDYLEVAEVFATHVNHSMG